MNTPRLLRQLMIAYFNMEHHDYVNHTMPEVLEPKKAEPRGRRWWMWDWDRRIEVHVSLWGGGSVPDKGSSPRGWPGTKTGLRPCNC